ncbi:MAG: OsmC family protein [Bacteroidales bacterium]
MDTSVKLKHLEKMSFEGDVNGHKIVIDAGSHAGGENKGPRPKPMMLLALAGCTAMDVVSILRKMRVELEDFDVEVQADQTTEHPKHYNKMHVIYYFKGKDLPKDKIEKAVNLSEERYCGVSYVYKNGPVQLSNEIQIENTD